MTIFSAGDWFMFAVAVLYVGASVSYFFSGNLPMTLVSFCYAISNCGLVWAAQWVFAKTYTP
jgi:hypothetical protein